MKVVVFRGFFFSVLPADVRLNNNKKKKRNPFDPMLLCVSSISNEIASERIRRNLF